MELFKREHDSGLVAVYMNDNSAIRHVGNTVNLLVTLRQMVSLIVNARQTTPPSEISTDN